LTSLLIVFRRVFTISYNEDFLADNEKFSSILAEFYFCACQSSPLGGLATELVSPYSSGTLNVRITLSAMSRPKAGKLQIQNYKSQINSKPEHINFREILCSAEHFEKVLGS